MSAGVKLPEQRLAMCKLILELVRDASSNYLEDPDAAATCGELMLCVATLLGQLQGRRMRAAKLASYTGMNRITATRRLHELEARGMVEKRPDGTYALPVARLNSPKDVAMLQRMMALVQATAQELFSLNT